MAATSFRALSGLLLTILLQKLCSAQLPFGFSGPPNTILFLNGFHFVSGNSSQEVSADHYCAIMSDDFLQCVVYSTDTKPAKLAAIEYIVSGRVFEGFPEEEKQLWHSHKYEVTSGFLIEPGMPAALDYTAMEMLVGTYGKTWQTWRWDQQNSSVPLGIPELLMGYTGDSQVTPAFVTQRDELFGVNTTEIRESRTLINETAEPTLPGADSWQRGFTLQLGILNNTDETSFDG